jgi:hypothetical protein
LKPLPLGEADARQRGGCEGLRICADLQPSPGASARWLSRRPLPEGEGKKDYSSEYMVNPDSTFG